MQVMQEYIDILNTEGMCTYFIKLSGKGLFYITSESMNTM